MAGKFHDGEVAKLLGACRRRCCICHRFCGTKIETHHMDPHGGDSIGNAIPVCFDCHAEIASYNPDHPRGRKFTVEELTLHKTAWLKACEKHPEVTVGASWQIDVGPLEALIQEMEFNECMCRDSSHIPPKFSSSHFHSAIRSGAILTLEPELKKKVFVAYGKVAFANVQIEHAVMQKNSEAYFPNVAANDAVGEAAITLWCAREALEEMLRPAEERFVPD